MLQANSIGGKAACSDFMLFTKSSGAINLHAYDAGGTCSELPSLLGFCLAFYMMYLVWLLCKDKGRSGSSRGLATEGRQFR